jgi:cytoskeletal protein CcmA (bactofilin family)
VIGEVVAEELAVGGRVEGKVSVRDHLHVAPGGIARGEVRYGSLQVERGGVIDGSTAHGDAPDDAGTVSVTGGAAPLPAARSVSVVS